MSNLWMALFIILTLSCLTGLLETIPLAVLGAVIEAAVMSLIDFPEMRRVRRRVYIISVYSRSLNLYTHTRARLTTLSNTYRRPSASPRSRAVS